MARKKRKKKIDLSNFQFRKRGPKLSQEKLAALPIWLPEEYRDFLVVHNGGVPVASTFRFPFEGIERISYVDYFYAVRSRSKKSSHDNLIDDGIIHHRNDLPRWSIPIARVDEDSFILIFEEGKYSQGVWYFAWLHDDPDVEPYVECEGALGKIADSIPEFLSLLKPARDFYSIVSYVVPQEISLAKIKRATKPLKMKWHLRDGPHGKYSFCNWELLNEKTMLDTTIFLVENGSLPKTFYGDLKLPKLDVPPQTEVMHLMVSSQFESEAIEQFPKLIGGWKPLPIHHQNW